MANVEYKPNPNGMRKLLNSDDYCGLCTKEAKTIADRANGMYGASGYMVSPGRPGRNRAHAIVYTGDMHSVNSNRVHNTLQKAID